MSSLHAFLARGLLLVSLVGCNELFGLDPVDYPSGGDGGAGGDGALVDAGSCVSPMLETWSPPTVGSFSFFGAIHHPTLTATRVLFADDTGKLFDTPHSGGSAGRITSLEVTGEKLGSPSITADGTTLVYTFAATDGSRAGLRRATRTGTAWMAPADLQVTGLGAATNVVASAPASYGGQWRMVLAIREPSSSDPRLVEVVSTDQLSWAPVDPPTFGWSTGGRRDEQPFLSPDGCFVVFASSRRDSMDIDLWYAVRTAAGDFDYPIALPYATGDEDEHGPAMTPDGQSLWFLRRYSGQDVNITMP